MKWEKPLKYTKQKPTLFIIKFGRHELCCQIIQVTSLCGHGQAAGAPSGPWSL